MEILPRERVIAALERRVTDRVPLDFWAVPEVWNKLRAYFGTTDDERVLTALDIDIRQFQPDYIGPPIRKQPDGSWFDAMGVHRRLVCNEFSTYEEYAGAPLGFAQNTKDLKLYDRWPNPDHFDFESLYQQIGNAHKTYYIKLQTGGLFETAWALRGYEQFFMDMVMDPDIVHSIMGRLCDFYCEYVRRAMQAAGNKYDMVYTYDDIASQNGLLMSREMWRGLIRPYHVKLNSVIHGFGKTIMYHSCGAVYDLINELAGLPIEVLNPIQPAAAGMDFARIKHNFGKKLCFHGGIDIQNTLPYGSECEVRAAARQARSTLGKGGGYILTSAHYIQADTPVQNILVLFDEAHKAVPAV